MVRRGSAVRVRQRASANRPVKQRFLDACTDVILDRRCPMRTHPVRNRAETGWPWNHAAPRFATRSRGLTPSSVLTTSVGGRRSGGRGCHARGAWRGVVASQAPPAVRRAASRSGSSLRAEHHSHQRPRAVHAPAISAHAHRRCESAGRTRVASASRLVPAQEHGPGAVITCGSRRYAAIPDEEHRTRPERRCHSEAS